MAGAVSNSYCAQKKHLTKEQIINGLPDGILKSFPVPVKWYDNKHIAVSYYKEGTGIMPGIKLLDIKTGDTSLIDEATLEVIDSRQNEMQDKKTAFEKAAGNDVYGRCLNITFSPDLSMIAYTRDNNLYIYSFSDKKETPITTDGTDVIKNGYASWVYYEEIFGRPSKYRAFWWSPDSKKLAFFRFDDSGVPMFPIYDCTGQHGFTRKTRYPKAGDKNPEVNIYIAHVSEGEKGVCISKTRADFDDHDDQYFGMPFWDADGSKLIVPWMPRVQNTLLLYSVSPDNGSKTRIYAEHQKTWIDWMTDMHFTDKGFYMVRDFSMWQQIYFQSFDGKTFVRLTDGRNWNIKIVKVDEKSGYIYFTARRNSSVREDFYRVDIKKHKMERLSSGDYYYSKVMLSDDNKYFAAVRSNCSTPNQFVVISTGRNHKTVYEADSKGDKFGDYEFAVPGIRYINTDGFHIPARVILPPDMDSTKKYPVLVYMYGGPDMPVVMDKWEGLGMKTQWWPEEGVIQVRMDHRGSGHNGKAGVNYMYRHFWTVELRDYISWMKYFFKFPYVNKAKTGIYGFSYGGSMTMLAVSEGNDYFKYGIAGGGVYDYRLYDTHYTERYMDTPHNNPDGYANTIMAGKIWKYKGDITNYVKITHGTSDDNVHFQNTMQLVKAMQMQGKQFDLMIYPGQLHGYHGPQRAQSDESDYIFWYRHLLDKKAPSVLLDSFKKYFINYTDKKDNN
jgi:dipeptidyl-peptidase-4